MESVDVNFWWHCEMIQTIGQFRDPKRGSNLNSGNLNSSSPLVVGNEDDGDGGIRLLRIELPSGELGIEDGVLLKWKTDFGLTLDNCVILGASSVFYPNSQDDDLLLMRLVVVVEITTMVVVVWIRENNRESRASKDFSV
ncbi:hypothetical protein RYX36_025339, partial [Vicia faba]